MPFRKLAADAIVLTAGWLTPDSDMRIRYQGDVPHHQALLSSDLVILVVGVS